MTKSNSPCWKKKTIKAFKAESEKKEKAKIETKVNIKNLIIEIFNKYPGVYSYYKDILANKKMPENEKKTYLKKYFTKVFKKYKEKKDRDNHIRLHTSVHQQMVLTPILFPQPVLLLPIFHPIMVQPPMAQAVTVQPPMAQAVTVQPPMAQAVTVQPPMAHPF